MVFRVESVDRDKAYQNHGVLARHTDGTPVVGVLEGIFVVTVGSSSLELFKVRWYRHLLRDTRFKGLLAVKAQGLRAAAVWDNQRSPWIEAARVEGQVFYTQDLTQGAVELQPLRGGAAESVSSGLRLSHVHLKVSSSYSIPEHLLPREE